MAMLQNEKLFTNVGADTAENGPHVAMMFADYGKFSNE